MRSETAFSRLRALVICSAWCLRTVEGVKRALWLIRRVCGPSYVEISSAALSEEDTLVRWRERT